jgi:hypothetical protein
MTPKAVKKAPSQARAKPASTTANKAKPGKKGSIAVKEPTKEPEVVKPPEPPKPPIDPLAVFRREILNKILAEIKVEEEVT